MDEFQKVCSALVQLSRLVVTGKTTDAVRFLQRVAFENRNSDALVWMELNNLTKTLSAPTENRSWAHISRVAEPPILPRGGDIPVDLLTKETPPIFLDVTPVFEHNVRSVLDMIVKERQAGKAILGAGLPLSSKLLFCGSPGVGKTLAAKWIANQLNLSLFTLNLAGVMSSFLGRTGNNIQQVFQFASRQPCILLLDEFDAIAKKRGDDTEIGELKRLVTVLLQEFDKFPSTSLLIAATNHQALLDPAVWRRFDITIEFPVPDEVCVAKAIQVFWGQDAEAAQDYSGVLATAMTGLSFSDIKRNIVRIRKRAIVANKQLEDCIVEWLIEQCATMRSSERKRFALLLTKKGYSQREVSNWTGVSRDTIRKGQKEGGL